MSMVARSAVRPDCSLNNNISSNESRTVVKATIALVDVANETVVRVTVVSVIVVRVTVVVVLVTVVRVTIVNDNRRKGGYRRKTKW